METRKRPPALPIAIVLVIAYLLVFPNHAGRELVVSLAWSTPLAGGPSSGEGESHAFRVGRQYGYVRTDGSLARLEPVFYDVTLNDDAYINYAKGAPSLVVRLRDGRIAGTLPGTAWPLLPAARRDTVYLFTSDLLSVAESTLDGSIRWTRDLGSLITCFAPVAGDTVRAVVGTLEGGLHVLDTGGEVVHTLSSPTGRIPGVYGCAATPDGRLIAVLLGLDPQQLSVHVADPSGYRMLWTRKHDPESRTEAVLRFTEDGRYLVADAGSGFRVHDARSGRSVHVPAPGYLESAVTVGRDIVVLTRNERGGALVVVSPPDIIAASVSLDGLPAVGESRHLSGHESWFLYGAGDRLARLDLSRL